MTTLLKQMPVNPIFNPAGNDDVASRSIWFGETTNLMQLNDVRYPWAIGLYEQMREQFWIPQKYDLTQDVTDYNNLTPAERRAFDGILSYLAFLDSIQACNLSHIKEVVTAPEVSLCIAEQTSQEYLHSKSYQYMIDSIIPKDRRNGIYDLWRTDKVLFERCENIASHYQSYSDNRSTDNYFLMLVANFLLEGIYFMNGFSFFYNLASRQLMPGSADIFRAINKDELSHIRLFQKLLPEAMEVFPYSADKIYEMTSQAVEYECVWTSHIIGEDILGITPESTETYTKYLANLRLKSIGLTPLYPEDRYKKNPYHHLERFADTKSDGNTKANFFEAGVTSYSMSASVTGWDDI
jgi:ribonucleoside-diphosphate reductase beta chain